MLHPTRCFAQFGITVREGRRGAATDLTVVAGGRYVVVVANVTAPNESTDPTVVYTDGSCSGNPGPGGWAWVIPGGAWASGSENPTTNQRMEVAAVLDALKTFDGPISVHSDSTYVVNCFRDSWWRGWLKRDWKNSAKKPVANRDLWEPLIAEYRRRIDAGIETTFTWVKGHSGDRWNERADELAVAAGSDQSDRRTGSPSDRGEGASAASGEAKAHASRRIVAGDANRPNGHLVAVVGHRPPELGGWDFPNPLGSTVVERLEAILAAKRQLDEDVVVVTGMGLGAEQFGAIAARNAAIPYVAVLAFPDPSAVWPAPSRERFDRLIDDAADVVVLERAVPDTKAKIAAALKRRDAWLARNADDAIVVWDQRDRFIQKTFERFSDSLGDDVWVLNPTELG